jgi:uncharacterized protein YdeI (YjbR/CyaY-like superfamily)
MNTVKEFPILTFASASQWAAWLEKHTDTADGIWIRFFKKGSGIETITYDQASEIALCYGWIDSQAKKYDEVSYLQKFTPRRSKSIWSKVNTQRVAQLLKEGKMKPSGLKQIEEAKKDGRWDAAYRSSSEITLPKEFLTELAKREKAQTFFNTLNKSNVYAIAWRLETARKPETKARRMQMILDMLEKGEKFH